MLTTQKQSKKPPYTLFALIGIVIILVVAYVGFAYTTKSAWPFVTTAEPEAPSADTSINYQPPTEQEVESSQDAKKNNAHQDADNQNDSGHTGEQNTVTKQSVSVGVAFASYDKDEKAVDVRAFTPDVIEGNGTCTATFTKDGKSVTRSSKAFIDYSTSQCEPILIPESEFTSTGTWRLTVSYSSTKHEGVSPVVMVDVTP